MKIDRKVVRSATTGKTTVTVTATSDDGIRAVFAQITTQSGIEETAKWVEKQAIGNLKQMTDARQQPMLEEA